MQLAGIPQINGQQTDYVSDYDNGRIINTVDELDDALNYYLFYLKIGIMRTPIP